MGWTIGVLGWRKNVVTDEVMTELGTNDLLKDFGKGRKDRNRTEIARVRWVTRLENGSYYCDFPGMGKGKGGNG